MALAHVYRNGEIVFRHKGRPCPKGALPLPDAPPSLIKAKARRAYNGKTLLVPGVPEAEDECDAIEALWDFADRLAGLA